MGILEDIKSMQQMGRTDQEIFSYLQGKGYNETQINNALSQLQIKQAINSPYPSYPQNASDLSPPAELNPPLPSQNTPLEIPTREQIRQTLGIQPSIMQNPPAPLPQEAFAPQYPEPPSPSQEIPVPTTTAITQEEYTPAMPYPEQNPPQQEYSPQEYPSDQYAQEYLSDQQYTQPQISSDIISEIADQILTEKLSSMRKQLEKALETNTLFEPKITNLDERLQKIEKIIDRLQLSIIQKIGEYGTAVTDLKKELIETQKSFKALSQKKSKSKKRSSRKRK